ncbi:acyltransferase domain-containing protein [Nonomuraea sp. NPDC055795]
MAVPFARSLPGFPAALAACLDCFAPELAERVERALLDPAFPAAGLRETELAQPSLFALEHAAATALMALGVRPASLIGHSLGEITAACLAGVFTLPDAARFVAVRGSAMQGCPPGAMIALGCPEAEATKLAAEAGVDLELAAVNSAGSCVLGGTVAAVERFELALGGKVVHHRLCTSHAFHTRLVQPAVPELAMELTDIRLRRPVLPYAANSTGRVIPAGVVVSPESFIEQARHPVRYAEAMASTALSLPGAVAVEIGPGTTLSDLAANLVTVPLSPGHASSRPADEVLNALGRLWTLGQPVDPRALCGTGRRVHLPSYPFAGPRWVAPEAVAKELDLALPVVESPSWDGVPVDRASEAPAVLAGLWAELLGQSDLTAESDFFQLGGDSLLITSLAGGGDPRGAALAAAPGRARHRRRLRRPGPRRRPGTGPGPRRRVPSGPAQVRGRAVVSRGGLLGGRLRRATRPRTPADRPGRARRGGQPGRPVLAGAVTRRPRPGPGRLRRRQRAQHHPPRRGGHGTVARRRA